MTNGAPIPERARPAGAISHVGMSGRPDPVPVSTMSTMLSQRSSVPLYQKTGLKKPNGKGGKASVKRRGNDKKPGGKPSGGGKSGGAGGGGAGLIYQDGPGQVMAFDQLIKKTPAPLQKIAGAIQQSAQSNGLQPQLLVGMAMMESSGCTNTKGQGCFQFTDDSAWAKYGGGKPKGDDTASAMAAGKYMHDLIQQNGNSLDKALRAYNGPIGQGGNPAYQKTIFGFMNGQGI